MKVNIQTPFSACYRYFELIFHQEQFVDFMDRQFKSTIQSYEQEISKRPEEEKYDGFYDYTKNLKASYSDCFLKSGFILSYSTMEMILKEFCDIARKEFKINRSWEDIQDVKGEMGKMIKYIEKELNIKINKTTCKHNLKPN